MKKQDVLHMSTEDLEENGNYDLIYTNMAIENEIRELHHQTKVYKDALFHLVDTIRVDSRKGELLAVRISEMDVAELKKLVAEECEERRELRDYRNAHDHTVELKSEVLDQVGPLDKDEEIVGSFECRIDSLRGFLVCTTKGLKFIQGGGKYERSFRKLFEANYEEIEVWKEANTNLVLTIQGEDYRKRLEPIGEPIENLEDIIEVFLGIRSVSPPYIHDMRVPSNIIHKMVN